MANSSGRVSTVPAGQFKNYRIAGNTLHFDRGSQGLDYFIGSNAHARSFAAAVDGFLFLSPAALFKTKRALSPGFERYSYPYTTRPVLPGCLQCHASGVNTRVGTHNGYSDPPFAEGGVSCERCHGAGERHAESARPEDIVNPAKLDHTRRASVCAQCHLTGEFRVNLPRKGPETFRAGDRLDDHIAVFVNETAPSGIAVTSHSEDLARSKCQPLWCGTCHSPHTAAPKPVCTTCHQNSSSKGDCMPCHMPKRNVRDADHVVFTDHSIPRRARVAAKPSGRLIPFPGSRAGEREIFLAAAQKALRDNTAAPPTPAIDDAEVLVYRAELHKRANEYEKAVPLYEAALARDANQVTAYAALGAIAMERGDAPAAVRHWRNALSRSPGLPLVRMNLALALLELRCKSEAEREIAEVIRLSPALDAAYRLRERIRRSAVQ
jgi:tetratricopeptide (TPR) repeat protein